MMTQEGRSAVLTWLKGVCAATPPTWNGFAMALVSSNITDLETYTYATNYSSWTKQTSGFSPSNPFTSASSLVSSVPTLAGAQVTWTNSTGSSVTIYGWALAFSAGGTNTLYNYKAFASPTVVANGATFQFTPTLDSPL